MPYIEAARIVSLVEKKRGSVKSLTLESNYKNKRQLMALVCETLKFSSLIQKILDSTNIQKQEKAIEDTSLAKVLLYDFLFGRGLNQAEMFQEVLQRHEEALTAEVDRIKTSMNVTDITDCLQPSTLNSAVIPRYVRINTLKSTVDEVIDTFVLEEYKLVSTKGCSYIQYLNIVQHLASDEFAIDMSVPELLVFSPGTEFHEHSLYLSGAIIIQDKASCLPAYVLNPPAGSHVIDCCAAPGNKTSHLAALMGNQGKIFAFDKDARRISTMNSMMERAGASCVQTSCADFLRVNPRDSKYADVEYVLVDPSCSGSGIVNRFSTGDSGPELEKRLESLASFQAMILRHAMSFPTVRHVVYSTCSIYDRENELVVADVLARLNGAYRLVDVTSPLGLPCHGNSSVFPDAEMCIRMTPGSSMTNGFFVARFERVAENNRNSMMGKKDGARRCQQEANKQKDVNESKAVAHGNETTKQRKRKRKVLKPKDETNAAGKRNIESSGVVKNKKQKRSKKHGGHRPVTA